MREILFRAISKARNDWVEGVPIESVNGVWYMVHGATEDAINTPNETDFVYSEIRPETIGQYLGETDSRGKKMFHGDLVEHHLYSGARPITSIRGFYVICEDIARYNWTPHSLSVVGNVYCEVSP